MSSSVRSLRHLYKDVQWRKTENINIFNDVFLGFYISFPLADNEKSSEMIINAMYYCPLCQYFWIVYVTLLNTIRKIFHGYSPVFTLCFINISNNATLSLCNQMLFIHSNPVFNVVIGENICSPLAKIIRSPLLDDTISSATLSASRILVARGYKSSFVHSISYPLVALWKLCHM